MPYYKARYCAAGVREKWSLYVLFIERATQILNAHGLYGMIVPNTFLAANFGVAIRKLLVEQTSIYKITDVSFINVFNQTGTYPVLLFYKNSPPDANAIDIEIATDTNLLQCTKRHTVLQQTIVSNDNYIITLNSNDAVNALMQKIRGNTHKLKTLATIFHWGTSISEFRKYKISAARYQQLPDSEKTNFAPVIQTANIKRYQIRWDGEYVQKSIYSDNTIEHFGNTKIVIARLTKTIQATVDTNGFFMGKASYIITNKIDNHFLIALLNSRLIQFYFNNYFETTHLSGGYLRFDIPYLQELPIKTLSSADALHKQICNNVKQLYRSQKLLRSANSDVSRNFYQAKIENIDRLINQQVYNLYDLTPSDINIIES
jgi:hypothetical protein